MPLTPQEEQELKELEEMEMLEKEEALPEMQKSWMNRMRAGEAKQPLGLARAEGELAGKIASGATLGLSNPVKNYGMTLARLLTGQGEERSVFEPESARLRGNQSFGQTLENEKAKTRQFEKEYPIAAPVAELAGGFMKGGVPDKVFGGIARGAEKLMPAVEGQGIRNFGRAIVKGAGTGAAGGATATLASNASKVAQGDDVGLLDNAGSSALIGGTIGAAVPTAVGVTKGGKYLYDKAAQGFAGMTDRQANVYKENAPEIDNLAKLIFGDAKTPARPQDAEKWVRESYAPVKEEVQRQISDLTQKRNALLPAGSSVKVPASTLSETGIPDIDSRMKDLRGLLTQKQTRQVNVPVTYKGNMGQIDPSTGAIMDDAGDWLARQGKPDFYSPNGAGELVPGFSKFKSPYPGVTDEVQQISVPMDAPSHYSISTPAAADLNTKMNMANKFSIFDPAGAKAAKDADLAGRAIALRKATLGGLGDKGDEFARLQGELAKRHEALAVGDRVFKGSPFKAGSTAGVDRAAVGGRLDDLVSEAQALEEGALGEVPALWNIREKAQTALSQGKDKVRNLFGIPGLPVGPLGRSMVKSRNTLDPAMEKLTQGADKATLKALLPLFLNRSEKDPSQSGY